MQLVKLMPPIWAQFVTGGSQTHKEMASRFLTNDQLGRNLNV